VSTTVPASTSTTAPANASSTSSTGPGPSTASTVSTVSTASTSVGDDVEAITEAFTVFFDGTVADVERKVSLLQDGDRYREMLTDAAADPVAQTLTTRVTRVTPLEETACRAAAIGSEVCAEVVHDLLVGGLPAFAAHQSYAVWQDDRWKVASSSWCDLVVIGGATCPPAA
jgi:hypothetical protein